MANRVTRALTGSLHHVVFLALTFLCITTTGCFSSRLHGATDANAQALKAVLHSDFVTTTGDRVSLADFEGKVVMLHLFASWCPVCTAEVPSLKSLATSFAGSDLEIVGVAISDDPFEATRFASRHQIPFPVLLDTTDELKHFFGIRELPATLFLDRSGRPITFKDPETGTTAAKLAGARNWNTTAPVEMIAGLLEESSDER